jgi:hypothetical protein
MLPVPRRPLVLALAATLSLAAACKKSGNAPAIEGVRPAAEASAGLLATVTLAPLQGITSHVDALSHTLGLPFTGKDLLTTLTAQYTLSPDALSQLDQGQPIAIAYVAPPGKDRPPLEALAATTAGPEATERLIAALGSVTPAGKGDGIRQVERPGGTPLFVAGSGKTFLVSSSREGLAAAGALAAQAQRPPANDLVATFHPEALARWRGTDVRTALAGFRKDLFAEQLAAAERRGGPVPGRAERVAWEAALQMLLDPLADTSADSLTLDIDPQRGIRFGARFQPRPGTDLARRVATPTPLAVDPALPALLAPAAPLIAVWGVGPSPFWSELYAAALDAQARAGIKGAAEVSTRFAQLRPLLTGTASGAVHGGSGGLTTGLVLALKPGTSPGTALDALGGLAGSSGFAALLSEVYGRQAPAVQSRRDGDTLRTELAFPVRDRPGDVGTALRAIFGSATLSTLASVSRGRLIAAVGPDARRALDGLASGPTPAPGGDVGAALTEARGSDGLFYLDAWAAARPLFTALSERGQASMLLSLPGLGGLKLPVVASYRGGEALTGELRIPLATLQNAAAVLRPLIGAGP